MHADTRMGVGSSIAEAAAGAVVRRYSGTCLYVFLVLCNMLRSQPTARYRLQRVIFQLPLLTMYTLLGVWWCAWVGGLVCWMQVLLLPFLPRSGAAIPEQGSIPCQQTAHPYLTRVCTTVSEAALLRWPACSAEIPPPALACSIAS